MSQVLKHHLLEAEMASVQVDRDEAGIQPEPLLATLSIVGGQQNQHLLDGLIQQFVELIDGDIFPCDTCFELRLLREVVGICKHSKARV